MGFTLMHVDDIVLASNRPGCMVVLFYNPLACRVVPLTLFDLTRTWDLDSRSYKRSYPIEPPGSQWRLRLSVCIGHSASR